MNLSKGTKRRWLAMLAICGTITTLLGGCSSYPVFVKAKSRRNLSSQRELVKRLQLQSMLKQLQGSDSDLSFAAALDEQYRKRAAENDIFVPNKNAPKFPIVGPTEIHAKRSVNLGDLPEKYRFVPNRLKADIEPKMKMVEPEDHGKRSLKEGTESYNSQPKLSWDIINRNVPLNAPPKQNSFNKRGAPCRKRRSADDIIIKKRHLKTPPGKGLVPQYNLYDEICEDSQPVEIVKIKKLIVEDGIIKDNDIVELSMLK